MIGTLIVTSGKVDYKYKVGENNCEVIVTSESGEQNKINIKVTRKDAYYLDDLETLLKDDKIKVRNYIKADRQWIKLLGKKQKLLGNMILYFPAIFGIAYRFYVNHFQKNPYE